MADLVSTPLIGYTAATGLTIAGVATGADPVLMGLGAFGGWFAISNIDMPIPVAVRINSVAMSSVMASYGATLAAIELCAHGYIAEANERPWAWGLAIVIGMLAVPVIGPLVMSAGRAVGKRLQRMAEKLGDLK